MQFKLYKNGLELSGNYESIHNHSASHENWSNYNNIFLNSPATTSSTTYTVYFKSLATGNSYVQYDSANSTMILAEVQQ